MKTKWNTAQNWIVCSSVSVRALQQPCKHTDVLSQCSNTTLIILQRCPRQSILPAVRTCRFTTADTHIRCSVPQNLTTLNCGISEWSRHDASLHQTWRRWGLRRAGAVFYWSCRPAVTLGQWLSSAEVQQNTQISLHQRSQYVWQRWYIEHYHHPLCCSEMSEPQWNPTEQKSLCYMRPAAKRDGMGVF